MILTAPEAELGSRVEALEADRENLYGSVQMLDGECRDTNRRQRADRRLIVAIRATQTEHGAKLDSLLVGQQRLENAAGLKQDASGLKQDVSVLKEDVSGFEEDVSGLKQDVSVLKEDVSGLK